MKNLKGLCVLMLLAAVIVGGIVLTHKKGTRFEPIKDQSQAVADSAKDSVTDAVNQAKLATGEMAGNVASATKAGIKKATDAVTNITTKTKVAASNMMRTVADVTTNTISEARQKMESAVN